MGRESIELGYPNSAVEKGWEWGGHGRGGEEGVQGCAVEHGIACGRLQERDVCAHMPIRPGSPKAWVTVEIPAPGLR